MTDAESFLAAICAAPADDTVRLVYADWLEEHGDGDRAEFIRVQWELALLGLRRELFVANSVGERLEGLGVALIPCGDGHYSASDAERGLSIEEFSPNERVDIYAHLARKDRVGWIRGLKYVKHVPERHEIIFRKDVDSKPWAGTELRRREWELLGDYVSIPWRKLPWGQAPRSAFRRGFVAEVTCSAEDWLRHADALHWHPGQTDACPGCVAGRVTCTRCFGTRANPDDDGNPCPWCHATGHEAECPDCGGTGRVPRPCPPTAQPIERVVLTTVPDWRAEGTTAGPFAGTTVRLPMSRTAHNDGRVIAWLNDQWPGITFSLPAAGDGTGVASEASEHLSYP